MHDAFSPQLFDDLIAYHNIARKTELCVAKSICLAVLNWLQVPPKFLRVLVFLCSAFCVRNRPVSSERNYL